MDTITTTGNGVKSDVDEGQSGYEAFCALVRELDTDEPDRELLQRFRDSLDDFPKARELFGTINDISRTAVLDYLGDTNNAYKTCIGKQMEALAMSLCDAPTPIEQ